MMATAARRGRRACRLIGSFSDGFVLMGQGQVTWVGFLPFFPVSLRIFLS